MKTSTNELKTERQWRSSTGYDESSFYNLLNLFKRTYFNIYNQTLSERQANGPKESEIKTEEDLLFFTLVAIKSGLTYDLLGLMFGMDGSSAFRNKDTGISILKSMLYDYGFTPARSFESIDEFEECFKKYSTLIIDGEEQPIQRPSDEDSQKDNYSGKKKTYSKSNGDNGIKWFKK